MAIKFQYNKTSLQQLEKQLKMRERSLPTIKSKESALRIEVKRTKDEVNKLELQLEQEIQSYENMVALWNEFNPGLIAVKDVTLSTKKIAGVVVPLLNEIKFENGKTYSVKARELYCDKELVSYECFIYNEGMEVASAVINAYQPQNSDELLKSGI